MDKRDILVNILAALRAVHLTHWTAHWVATDYGDHLLMARLYEAVEEETDALAEKIVQQCGASAVQTQNVLQLTLAFLSHLSGPDGIVRSFAAEELLCAALNSAYKLLKDSAQLDLGLDDYIMSTINAHDTAKYLLQQRIGKGSSC